MTEERLCDTAKLVGFNQFDDIVYSARLPLREYYEGERPWDSTEGMLESGIVKLTGTLYDASGNITQEFESAFAADTGKYVGGRATFDGGETRCDGVYSDHAVNCIQMKRPPMPLVPSGLSPDCPDVIGETLTIRCVSGWGWNLKAEGEISTIESGSILSSEIEVVPERYVDFTGPRCCISGRVTRSPAGYCLERFVAFIMSDGCDYNFTDNIAHSWRVMVGDGELDCDYDWFPILNGRKVYFGFGTVGLDSEWLDLAEAKNVIWNIDSVNKMRVLLGEPSERTPSPPGNEKYVSQFTYRDRWKSLHLIIRERPDGSLKFIIDDQKRRWRSAMQ